MPFNPRETCALYDTHRERWELEQDFAEPTLDVFTAGKHLPRFSSKESQTDYDFRRRMSVPMDLCQDGIRIRVDNLFRTPPERVIEDGPHAQLITDILADADGDGTDMDPFMRDVLAGLYTSGCDIVTQTSAADGSAIETLADQQAANIRPYWIRFTPLQRVAWSTNGARNFLWARYNLGTEPSTDETGGGQQADVYLTVTPTEWRVHKVYAGEDEKGELRVETTEGVNPLGACPIVKAYFQESQKPGNGGVPIGLITRPAHIAKVLLNQKSQADAELLAAVPRWAWFGADSAPDAYGPGALWASNNPDGKLLVVQADVGHIVEKRLWCVWYISEILRLLKFRGGMGDIEGNQGSGVKLALEMTDLHTELLATAAQMENLEREMLRQAVSMATGTVIAPEDAADVLKYKVTYNRQYRLEPVGEILANLKAWAVDLGFVAETVPSMTKEMLRGLANVTLRDGSPSADDIEAEIDALPTGAAESGAV